MFDDELTRRVQEQYDIDKHVDAAEARLREEEARVESTRHSLDALRRDAEANRERVRADLVNNGRTGIEAGGSRGVNKYAAEYTPPVPARPAARGGFVRGELRRKRAQLSRRKGWRGVAWRGVFRAAGVVRVQARLVARDVARDASSIRCLVSRKKKPAAPPPPPPVARIGQGSGVVRGHSRTTKNGTTTYVVTHQRKGQK